MFDRHYLDKNRFDNRLSIAVITTAIVLAALSRLIPHPWNFSPLEAMALFAGARIANRNIALLVPLLALLISDLFIGFYADIWVVYLCFIAMAYAGRSLQNASALKIALYGFGAAWGFFIVTNFSVWALGNMYPHTVSGLIACYLSAIPFFHNQLAGVAFYGILLFGSYALLQRYWLRPGTMQTSR